VLTLTVLGCDGSHQAAGGAASGYLVRSWASGTSVWLDAGPGTFANLQRFTDPLTLSAIVLTHEHHDHFSDVEGFITAARWVYGFHRDPVPVYAAPGVLEHLSQEVDGMATRLEGPSGALGYSADSGPEWSLSSFGPDLDLALCEATYTFEHEGTAGHMSGRQAGANARDAGARRLVVTHRWPTVTAEAILAEATETFGGHVDQAAVARGYSL
jgi:ribonuclease BN (tRNA processing enzyme)